MIRRSNISVRTVVVAILISVALSALSFVSCKRSATSVAILFPEKNEALSGGTATVFDKTINAFALPIPGLTSEEELLFFVGNSFFNQNWVQAPSSTTARDGLGPYFNARSCSGCHFKDGRGQPPATIGQESEGFLLRLSVPGTNPHGGPLGDPHYGGQFHDHAIDGVTREGRYEIIWEEVSGQYADGTIYTLRKPGFRFTELAYGPMHKDVMISPRVAPQMIGMGLLEAIEEKTILALADEHDANGDGISGRPNYVWNSIENKTQLGRFGWKANEPSILQQISGAFNGDMGITTPHFKDQHIVDAHAHLNQLPTGGDPEIPEDDLFKLHLYSATLAVPARRNVDDQQVLQGKKIFREIGCGHCHVETLQTGTHPLFSVLSNQTIHPYTDLLLHDMGPGLADNRPDFLATGTEWRTPPLWGIGLFHVVNKHTLYLHDARARTLEEAILWHSGEASSAQQKFTQLPKSDREKLIRFLESL